MRIGSSIALMIIGAILTFAVTKNIPGINLTIIGYIFMAGGALGLVLSIIGSLRRTSATGRQPGPAQQSPQGWQQPGAGQQQPGQGWEQSGQGQFRDQSPQQRNIPRPPENP